MPGGLAQHAPHMKQQAPVGAPEHGNFKNRTGVFYYAANITRRGVTQMTKTIMFVLFMTAFHVTAHAGSLAVRGSVDDFNTDEDMEVYELAYVQDLPWAWERRSTRIQWQVEVTGGVIDGGNETGFLGTLVPKVAFQKNRFFFDIGGGLAVLGEDELGRQDFGGNLQFIAQGGGGYMLTDRFSAGLQLRHMSDAGIHDDAEDMNIFLLELRYHFQ